MLLFLYLILYFEQSFAQVGPCDSSSFIEQFEGFHASVGPSASGEAVICFGYYLDVTTKSYTDILQRALGLTPQQARSMIFTRQQCEVPTSPSEMFFLNQPDKFLFFFR